MLRVLCHLPCFDYFVLNVSCRVICAYDLSGVRFAMSRYSLFYYLYVPQAVHEVSNLGGTVADHVGAYHRDQPPFIYPSPCILR